jgi:Ca-activated chloride channel family protein
VSLGDFFLLPQAWPILLLAPLLWLVQRVLRQQRLRRSQAALGPRAAALSSESRPGINRRADAWFASGVLLAGLAVMQPAGDSVASTDEPGATDLLICLDVSRSMLARDLAPSRLARAHAEIRDLAQRARGDRLGLIAFAGEARLLVPLTQDLELFAEMLSLAEPGSAGLGGTDLGAALAAALAAFDSADAGRRAGSILLLTDGEDLEQQGVRAAAACAARGVPVHCLALGSAQGSKIVIPGQSGEEFLRDRAGTEVLSTADPAGLRAIASATGGAFLEAAASQQALVRIYEDRILGQQRPNEDASAPPQRANLFALPLLAAFLLWILEIALGGRARA